MTVGAQPRRVGEDVRNLRRIEPSRSSSACHETSIIQQNINRSRAMAPNRGSRRKAALDVDKDSQEARVHGGRRGANE